MPDRSRGVAAAAKGRVEQRNEQTHIRQPREQWQKADDRKRKPATSDEQTDDHERKPHYDT